EMCIRDRPWGLRTLAYPIRKQREGYYVFTLFSLDAAAVARFEQRLRLIEDVLRYLIVRTDEDEEASDATGEASPAELSQPT
ncbi:MAG: 30S ribosomal protein S6, partial [Thermoflexales bacterium]|nr:30S ribosomal protein S6 [Thermoflexales bacterium]